MSAFTQDFARNEDWQQCQRSRRAATTALYLFVVAVMLASVVGFVNWGGL